MVAHIIGIDLAARVGHSSALAGALESLTETQIRKANAGNLATFTAIRRAYVFGESWMIKCTRRDSTPRADLATNSRI
jgi:hypothetical protein